MYLASHNSNCTRMYNTLLFKQRTCNLQRIYGIEKLKSETACTKTAKFSVTK